MADSEEVERTPDGRHLVIDGRRWRASDPAIPDGLRQELVDELMSARRAVRAKEPDARTRVGDAKVALGERGAPWWEELSDDDFSARAEATVRALLRHRGGSTICPSDVARVVGGEGWRGRMDDVRRVVAALAERDVVVATQKGEPVVANRARGPIRIARGPEFGS
ncbi:DUF3253 domain-containing protein [Nocardioides daphniae]|uniref:DUF3253 domain-containing protein n=1 Tax=Nocardioides daphniae TaxID=402297 RepID=A0A4P7UF81_9ACTN|nr:DUF3253 domain-containing protein [Nocardioides daphniae]QCC77519.1 DUF3253 domain-containing protein [Nocardioides daphniae]GGD31182.1 hypothetical protein GCM10007231_33410 [Nocardioides daphniae]